MSPDVLLEIAWKSILISGAVLMLDCILRTGSPRQRVFLLRYGIGLLLILPLLQLGVPHLDVPIPHLRIDVPRTGLVVPERAILTMSPNANVFENVLSFPPKKSLLLLLWLAGALLMLSRVAIGIAMLARWTNSARPVECPHWRSAICETSTAAKVKGEIKLLVTPADRSPLSWGWLRPVILIDSTSLAARSEARAVLAHEVAHIARGDWPALILSHVAVAVFWFNPLVWLHQRRLMERTEEAADAQALQEIPSLDYAQTLLTYVNRNLSVPLTLGVAGHRKAIRRRLVRILGGKNVGAPMSRFSLGAAILVATTLGVAVGVAHPVPERLKHGILHSWQPAFAPVAANVYSRYDSASHFHAGAAVGQPDASKLPHAPANQAADKSQDLVSASRSGADRAGLWDLRDENPHNAEVERASDSIDASNRALEAWNDSLEAWNRDQEARNRTTEPAKMGE